MKVGWKEWVGVAITLAGLIGIPFWVQAYSRSFDPPDRRVIHLTGVMKDGAWTLEKVTALNYGVKTFEPAESVIEPGERVLFRLTSADVTHGFYVPELGLGPVEVEPGHVEELVYNADTTGVFMYYCTYVCGDCHHYMRGNVIIGSPNATLQLIVAETPATCLHSGHEPEPSSDLLERGRSVFEAKGCVACHGSAGRGGVYNPNYINDTVPRLDLLAERMHLFDEEDVETIIEMFEQGDNLEAALEDPPFRRYNRFFAQYESVSTVIRDGKPAARKDTTWVHPPLNMPSWEAELTNPDINAVIAYLLNEFPWEEE
jgi:mono/diheme cytochrome c family protein/plastocyanin